MPVYQETCVKILCHIHIVYQTWKNSAQQREGGTLLIFDRSICR